MEKEHQFRIIGNGSNRLSGNDDVFSHLGEKPFYGNEGFRTVTPFILVRIQVPLHAS